MPYKPKTYSQYAMYAGNATHPSGQKHTVHAQTRYVPRHKYTESREQIMNGSNVLEGLSRKIETFIVNTAQAVDMHASM
jgi:hypothetical protein